METPPPTPPPTPPLTTMHDTHLHSTVKMITNPWGEKYSEKEFKEKLNPQWRYHVTPNFIPKFNR